MNNLFGDEYIGTYNESAKDSGPVTCLGMTFDNDDARREYFREELRKKLPELKHIEGFPIGEDEDIINLSDPPYYTACPNPWLNYFIAEWEQEKIELEKQGKRTADFQVNEPYASDVSEGKNNPIYMAHAYHTKVPHPAIMRYILHYTQPGDIVFDGFCGTGMTGVAAHLCGSIEETTKVGYTNFDKIGVRHSICSELSPFASNIAYNYNTPTDSRALIKEAKKIIDEVNSECSWMYQNFDENGVHNGRLDFVVFSEFFICPNCGRSVQYWEAAVDHENKCLKDTFSCPQCFSIMDKSCEREFTTKFDDILGESISIVKISPALVVCTKANGQRLERPANSYDVELIEKIESCQLEYDVPKAHLPNGYNTQQPIRTQGIKYVHQFFTRRNLITLSCLVSKINTSKYAEKLRFIFTGLMSRATNRNRFSPRNYFYGGGGWNLTGMSGTLYIPSLPIETSLLEILKTRLSTLSQIASLLPQKYTSNISINSACQLPINNNSIDYIFVDPPFGSNIMYSELNFIPEAWLKIYTNYKTEAIVNKVHNKSLTDYQTLMNRSFKEFYRVLKPGKWITIEFSNTSASVWNSIQNSLQGVGFVVANVAALDKKQGSFKAVTTTTAVKQDLVITCYKPTDELINKFKQSEDVTVNVWDFIEELLLHLPVHLEKDMKTTAVVERNPKILFDRLISYYVQRGYPVPMNAQEFQQGLRDRFIERDGMFFTAEQSLEYEQKRAETISFEAAQSLFVGSEAEGIEWLKRQLETPLTYQELQPEWMQALVSTKKGDQLPELLQILEENFLKDEDGRWYKPNPEKEADLEKLRTAHLLKLFNRYVEEASKPKGKIKEARLEALRCGFKDCYRNKDFKTIVTVAQRLPESLVMEDEVLLQYYDIAINRV